jgi:hypothetical protein
MTQDNDESKTYTVVVYGMGYWGCGNTHKEAAEIAEEYGHRLTDNHFIGLFSEPIQNVSAGCDGVHWKWADKEGVVLWAELNA